MKIISSKDYVREIIKDRKQSLMKENAVILKEENEKKKKDEEATELYESLLSVRTLPAKYNAFITSVKEEFMEKCIYSIFNESLNIFDRRNEKQELVKRALVKNFIQEQGVDSLLSRFRKQNVLLSEFAFIIDKAVKEVTESTNAKNINSWTVDTDTKDRFIKDLDNCNSKDAIITITDRVTDAETEFINDNTRRKMEIDDILQAKKERLDAIEEKPEDVKESVAAAYDRKIKAIKNRHIGSIYQIMAESMTKNSLSDPSLKNVYIKEGTLDMKTLLEDVGIMYTFLETLYTTEMVNDKYVQEFVNKI